MQVSTPHSGFGVPPPQGVSGAVRAPAAADHGRSAPQHRGRGKRRGGKTRSCVGCGERVVLSRARSQLIRLVLVARADCGGVDVVVDLAGRAMGRGAWLHAREACVARAAKDGLARAAKGRVHTNCAALRNAIAAAALRRADGLLLSARRARLLAVGADAVRDALAASRVQLLLLARDAAAAARTAAVVRCQARGLALMWSNKTRLGELLGRREVAVVAVEDAGLAVALAAAISCWETFAAERGTAASAAAKVVAAATSVRGESNSDE